MTTLTTFRERGIRSYFPIKTGLIGFTACWLFYSPIRMTAQECPPDLIVTGPSTGLWVAPTDQGEGPWRVMITARGAGGGDEGGGGNAGGQGAEVIAEFAVQNGETILAIAGEPGGTGDTDAGGGGGGSGAVNCGTLPNCATGTILIVAAGGNGGESQGPGNGGQALNGPPGAGGVGGGANGGGGGGGMLSGGQPGGDGTGGSQVSSFGLVPGGFGSDDFNNGGEGMGGGGGGGSHPNNGSGGGAGRSGAAGGNINFSTSYIHPSGTNTQGTDGFSGAGPSAGTVTVACLGSLPIHLINFKAVIRDESVNLIWSTASEKDNHGYDVQRSADNRNWTTLGFVPGNGTTAEKSEYIFADDQPLSGVNYYRLKQMDTDGSFYHTPMVVADVRANALQFDVFPNPSTNGALTFRTVSKQEGDALFEIWDWAGYKVWKETHHLWEGTTVWPVSMTNFPKGAYTVRLQMPDGTSEFRKIVLQ